MNLQRSRFHDDDVHTYGMGAGIVPVAKVPGDGYYLLLGRGRSPTVEGLVSVVGI